MISTSRKNYVVVTLSIILLLLTVFVSLQNTPKAHAQAVKPSALTTILVQGAFSCYNNPIVNIWVQSSGGGSKFTDGFGQTTSKDGIFAAYIKTMLPTQIQIHVGCGWSKWRWWSDNWTPYTLVTSDMLARTNGMVTLSGACNDTVHAYGYNKRCWYGQSVSQYFAIQWAARLIGKGREYYGLCLQFVFDAYEKTSSTRVRPYVNFHPINDSTYAGDIYPKFNYGLQNHDAYPPAGALIFFMQKPGYDHTWSHVALSTGNGWFISSPTTKTGPHSVVFQDTIAHHDSYAYNHYAGWWLFA